MSKQKDTSKSEAVTDQGTEAQETTKICGIVMPIAAMLPEYTESHWSDVKNIIIEAASMAGYQACLVSDSESVNIIQKDIVQNLYTNDIVICDVSNLNPNVMFELGLRLVFDKPTIIIKDDKTKYVFDIGIIRHLEYPRDLRYAAINKFKKDLCKLIEGTMAASKDPQYSPFLKHFKDITITKPILEKEEISADIALLAKMSSQISDIQNRISDMPYQQDTRVNKYFLTRKALEKEFEIFMENLAFLDRTLYREDQDRWKADFQNWLNKRHGICVYLGEEPLDKVIDNIVSDWAIIF